MQLFKRHPAPVLKSNRPQDLFTMMNEMMNSMWTDGSYAKDFSPSVEVKESKNEYTVIAELPGMAKEDLDVHLENNALFMRGEKKVERQNKEDEKTQYSERFYGSFMRTIPFAEEIDASKVDAEFKNGLLTVKLPKKPTDRAAANRISIK